MKNNSITKTRRIAGLVLMVVGTLALCGSSATKLAHVPKVVAELSQLGFDGFKLQIVIALEILSATLFIIPWTRAFGLLLVSAYFGGAIATHLQHNQSPFSPALFLTLLWLGTWLRHPAVLWSFKGEMLFKNDAPAVVPTPATNPR